VTNQARVLFYSVNGVGVGHLTRLIAIARAMRSLYSASSKAPEFFFLSSSEADGMIYAEGFPSLKVPSREMMNSLGYGREEYSPLARTLILQLLATLSPDLLVVDTFPGGGFWEDLPRRVSGKRAFIYRPGKGTYFSQAYFQEMLTHYDAILIPEYKEHAAEVLYPLECESRVKFVGPILARYRSEMFTRVTARQMLGIPENVIAIHISTGGGGTSVAEERIAIALEAVDGLGENVYVCVAAGPLYRGFGARGERVIWANRGGFAELLPAFDISVSAAGYNSYGELMYAGVPTVFIPLETTEDIQIERALRAQSSGAAAMLPSNASANEICKAIRSLLSQDVWVRASSAARSLVPTNHALDAAQEIGSLIGLEVLRYRSEDGSIARATNSKLRSDSF
jgi:UDP-N-acetylglucosamine--N-acetylmuramyl-(pentapeptide) pyrophosphoryl-undecaprenol N-acetylglucosamine transferase